MSLNPTAPAWGYGYVVQDDIQNRIIGNVLEIIEAIGLPQKQEDSVKSLIKSKVWEMFNDAVLIKPERMNEIMKLYYKTRSQQAKDGYPMIAI